MRINKVPQYKLSSECWPVQLWGTNTCESCEFKDSDECGGLKIRKTGKNEKGYVVPLDERTNNHANTERD